MTPSSPSHPPKWRGWLVAMPLAAALTLAGCSTVASVPASGTSTAQSTETDTTQTETASQLTGATDYPPAARYRFETPYLVTESNTGRMIWQRR